LGITRTAVSAAGNVVSPILVYVLQAAAKRVTAVAAARRAKRAATGLALYLAGYYMPEP